VVFWASRIRVHEGGVRGQALIRVYRELLGGQAWIRVFSSLGILDYEFWVFLDIGLGFDERLHEVKLKLGF
jgi:hypothetical protein